MKWSAFFLAASISTAGYSQVSINEFIGASLSAPAYKNIDDRLSFLQNKTYRLSPLQKLEFRTQNRELMKSQQEFGIRFTPANPWEVANNNRYFSEFQSFLALEKSLALRGLLVTRYHLVIDFIYYNELLKLSKASTELIQSQLNILEKQSASSLFNAEDFVKAKVTLIDKEVDGEEILLEVMAQEAAVAMEYQKAGLSSLNWSISEVVDLKRVNTIVDSLQALSNLSAQVAYQRQKISLKQSEYKLEKANVNVGFLQTEYDHRRVEQGRTPYNISMGITIPITNPNKGDMAKKKMDVIEAEYELKEAEGEVTTSREMMYRQLSRAIARYNELGIKIEDLSKSDLASQLSQRSGGNPLALIQFQESMNKLRVVQLKLWRRIFVSYTEYLATSDHLQKTPLVNFLSPRLETSR